MGLNFTLIKFQNTQMPLPEEIGVELLKITELELEHRIVQNGGAFFVKNHKYRFEYVEYEIEGQEIIVGSTFRKRHYLRSALIAALYNLGAEQDYPLPKWAWKKWKDIKWWHFVRR